MMALWMTWAAAQSALVGIAQLPEPPQQDAGRGAETKRWNYPKVEPIAGPSVTEIETSMRRGVDFLLKTQNKNGSWGSATRTKGLNIYAPVPGAHQAFRAAVTSLVLMALIELEQDFPECRPAIEKGEAWLLENLGKVRRANGDAIYNVWTHAYAISALVRMHERTSSVERRRQIAAAMRGEFDKLSRYESVDGGWGYYDFRYQTRKPSSDSSSFTTATAVVALYEARQIGIEPDAKIVERALASIRRQRLPDTSYLYGEYMKYRPQHAINRPGGSLGRSQACNLALELWGDEKVTHEVYRMWLHRLFARQGWLDIARKRPIPHESWFAVAGYFYYYGHFYGSLCIHRLPPEERSMFQAHLAHVIMRRQEKNGSWWDYPFYNYHEPYGTAFGLMILKRCLPGPLKVLPGDRSSADPKTLKKPAAEPSKKGSEQPSQEPPEQPLETRLELRSQGD